MNRVIVYIDGFNLYFGLREQGWQRYYWLNLQLLAENLLKPGQALQGVKYFTTRISWNPKYPDRHKRQSLFLDAVDTLPKVTTFYGHYLPKQVQCRRCGSTWESHEEKMTDVQIAVQLVRDAYEDGFDTALLLSADSDLAPPVEAVLEKFPTKRVIVVEPPARHSQKLSSVATARFKLGRRRLAESQFPDEYAKADGFVLRRPATWKDTN